MEIRHLNGTFKTEDELREEALELLEDELDSLTTAEQLVLGNRYRDENNYCLLKTFDDYEVNEALEDVDPWEIIQLEISGNYEFFTFDGWDFTETDDVWYDVEVSRLAEDILEGEYRDYLPTEIKDVLLEYEVAVDELEELENMNPYQREALDLVTRYVNCEATEVDLLVLLDKLSRKDDAWS